MPGARNYGRPGVREHRDRGPCRLPRKRAAFPCDNLHRSGKPARQARRAGTLTARVPSAMTPLADAPVRRCPDDGVNPFLWEEHGEIPRRGQSPVAGPTAELES